MQVNGVISVSNFYLVSFDAFNTERNFKIYNLLGVTAYT